MEWVEALCAGAQGMGEGRMGEGIGKAATAKLWGTQGVEAAF